MIQTTVAVAMLAKLLLDAMLYAAGALVVCAALAGAGVGIAFLLVRRVWRSHVAARR